MIRNFLLVVFGLLTIPAILGQKDTATINALNLESENLYANDADKSLELSERALRLSKENHYRKGEAFASLNLAIANDIKGNSKIATDYFHRAIHLYKLENDEESLSYCYSQIGVCYFSQFQYNNANYYYKKSIELCKKLKLEIDLADVLVNQGITLTYLNKLSQAKKNFQRAIAIYNRHNDEEGLGPAFNSLAKIYYEEGDLEKATRYFKYAASLAKKYENYYNLTSSYNAVANCYLDKKDYQTAKDYALKSLNYAKESGAKERELFVHQTLSDVYFGLGEYEKAFESLSLYANMKDSIFTLEKSDALAEMQARFEVKEIRLTQQIQAEKHSWQLLTLAVVIFIILLILVFLFFLFRHKKRINALLEQKYEMTQLNLEQKEFMMGEIHHRVKNNLQMVHAILDLQARDLKDPESAKLIEDSLNRINAISLIHQKLYQTDNIRAVRMNEYLRELVDDFVHHFRKEVSKQIRVRYELEDLNLDIETALPIGLIVAELVTNSCKYAFAEQETPEIELRLKEQGKQLVLFVADNGAGKSGEQNGTNFGTKLIQTMSKKLKAELVETSSDQGLKTELFISNYKVYHD